MADLISTPGGQPHKRNQLYVDDADGSHSEKQSSNLYLWDSGWRKLTPADLAGTVSVGGNVTVVQPTAASLLGVTYATTDAIYSGTTALTPKWAFVNVAASQTDSAVVAAVTSKRIRVIALAMVTGATATNVTFNSKPGGAGAAITALFANAANGGAVLPSNQWGWFQTVSGEGLAVTTGAGSTTGITVQYVEV